eukprot:gene11113-3174_t
MDARLIRSWKVEQEEEQEEQEVEQEEEQEEQEVEQEEQEVEQEEQEVEQEEQVLVKAVNVILRSGTRRRSCMLPAEFGIEREDASAQPHSCKQTRRSCSCFMNIYITALLLVLCHSNHQCEGNNIRMNTASRSDTQVVSSPSDTTQSVRFSPVPYSDTTMLLLAGSWDCSARVWEIDRSSATSKPISTQQMDAPVLDLDFRHDGTASFLACADNIAKIWDFSSNSTTIVGKHDAPIKSCNWIPHLSVLMTGSWDGTVRFWDLRSPSPAKVLKLSERVYSADVYENFACIATADRQVHSINLTNEPTIFETHETTLKMQTRCVRCFPAKDGFAAGTIEGRCAIVYTSQERKSQTFSFKCHRSNGNKTIYSVNSISFHPIFKTFLTAGSDGIIQFWDKESKQRITSISCPSKGTAIINTDFSHDGSLLAYSAGNDWSHGQKKSTSTNAIFIHSVNMKDVKLSQH